MRGDEIPAAEAADIVGRAPQLCPPVRPRLVDGVALLTSGDDLIIDGTDRVQILRGPATRSVLPRLIPLLDGTRTRAELGGLLRDVPDRVLQAIIALLFTRGLLEDGTPRSAANCRNLFFSRHIDLTRFNRNRDQAAARVDAARVLLSGDRELAAEVGAELQRAGFQLVDTLPRATLAVALDTGHAADDLAAFDARCASSAVPWLRVAAAGDRVEIGPYFCRGVRCCYACFASLRRERRRAVSLSAAQRRLAAGLTTTEVVYWVSKIARPVSFRGCVELDLIRGTRVESRTARRPGCHRCLPEPGRGPKPAPPALAYEDAVISAEKQWLAPRDHQLHYAAGLRELQRVEKTPTADPTPLPSPRFSGANGGRITADLIALLLSRSVGRRRNPADGRVRRWAPTVGNLGSPQAYVISDGTAGFPAGRWRYRASDHTLIRIPSFAAPRPGAAPVLVVLTAALDRVCAKYGLLGYRLALLDAGVAVCQLQAVAAAVGVVAALVGRWDDRRICADLDTLPSVEPITSVVALGVTRPASGGVEPCRGDPNPGRAATEPARLMYDLIRSAARGAGRGPTLALCARRAMSPRLSGALVRRRAVRAFSAEAVPHAVLERALAAAVDDTACAAGLFEAVVVAWRIDALAPGTYRRRPGRGLERLAAAPAATGDTLRQPEFADAAAIVHIVANLAAAVTRYGAHGHRMLTVAAGFAAHRAWLSVVAYGYGGCLFEGLLPNELGRLVGTDGWSQSQLLAVAVGASA